VREAIENHENRRKKSLPNFAKFVTAELRKNRELSSRLEKRRLATEEQKVESAPKGKEEIARLLPNKWERTREMLVRGL
jgi:hypothetical protein